MNLWNRVKALFNEAESSTKQEPADHSILTRHQDEREAFAVWREGIIARRLKDWFADQYAVFLTYPQQVDEALDFLDTPSSKGFVVHFHKTQYSLREAEFFQLYLREKVLSQNYRTQVADTKAYAIDAGTERNDRYYLKPRPDWSPPEGHQGGINTHSADQFDQQFGNVLIELVVRNDKPHHLKFSATIYHDRVYQKAQSFGALMQVVLK